jgi:hypothetical protein
MNNALKLLTVAVITGAATAAFAGLSGGLFRPGAESARITGDYLEARTASVFCGACHYNGELVTTGHDAVMAWKFDSGTYNGVSLKGLRAMAAVTGDENLSLNYNNRRSQLVIDTAATSEQASAIVALLKKKVGKQLGEVVATTRAPIFFSHSDAGYKVSSEGFASLSVNFLTDNGCCAQPGLVWYEPLAPISNRKVGYTESAAFTGSLTSPWNRSGEDSAFYGAIAF